MVAPGGDPGSRSGQVDGNRAGLRIRGAVSQLAGDIRAPALDVAILQESTSMPGAGRQVDGFIRQTGDENGGNLRKPGGSAIAQLAVRIPPSTARGHPPGERKCALRRQPD